MKKFLYVLILFSLTIILSCNNAGYCHVEGNVYEEGSNVPIFNAYVRINKYSKTNSHYPFKEATTDKNGHFKITYFKSTGGSKIYLDIISGEHISLFNKFVDSKNTNISAILKPYGYVKFRVKNNSANNATVYANVEMQDSYNSSVAVAANSIVTFDKTQKVILNKYSKLSWSYYSNNSSSAITYDSVLVTNKFDTLNIPHTNKLKKQNMDYNKFESVMQEHTDEKLITVLKNRNFYQEDAMTAAVNEATKRRIILNAEDMEIKFPLTSTAITADGIVGTDDPNKAAIKERAQKDILYGALWCVGGTVATLADVGYIFWGAIVFGGVQLIKGIINSQ